MEVDTVVSDIDEVTKKISVKVPQERVMKEFDAAITSIARTTRLKGFRPGKAPKDVVEKLLGDRVKLDVMNKLINEAIRSIAEVNKLDVVGEPALEVNTIEKSAPFEFSATLSLYPQPTIGNYNQRTVDVVKKVVADKDVQNAITRIRDSKAELKKVEDRTTAQFGDVVALSVGVATEGQAPARAEPFVDELGAGKLPELVEEKIKGMEVGASNEIPIPAEGEGAKESIYHITLHGIFDKKLPELDETLVKSLDLGAETVDELTIKVREKLEEQVANEARLDAQEALLSLLVNEHQFKVPQVMVDNEIRGMVARYSSEGGNRKVDPDKIPVESYRDALGSHALERIRCSIIVDRIADQEKITVDDADKEKLIRDVAARSGGSVDQTRKALLDKNQIMTFLLEARRTKVLDYLLGQTSITYKEEAAETEKAA